MGLRKGTGECLSTWRYPSVGGPREDLDMCVCVCMCVCLCVCTCMCVLVCMYVYVCVHVCV